MNDITPVWTKTFPTEFGYYWIRYEASDSISDRDETIVFWNPEIQYAEQAGALVSMSVEDLTDWRVEFWPIKLTPPL